MEINDILFNGKMFCRITEVTYTPFDNIACIVASDWCQYIGDTYTTNQRQILKLSEVKNYQNITESI